MPTSKTEQEANATPGHVASTDGLGPNVPERRECDAPICPWCDRQGWNTCGSHYDTYTCEARYDLR